MILNQGGVNASSFSMQVNGVEFDYDNIQRIEFYLEESMHDMAVVSLSSIPSRAVTDYVGVAVSITVTNSVNNVYQFVGYINDVRPMSLTSAGMMNNSPFQKAELYCMGASYVMRGSKTRNWDNQSITEIATTLAEEYDFSVDVPVKESFHDRLAQTNESDWQFLARYAKSLGLSVNVHGTHLHVYDPYSAYSRNTSYLRLYTLKGMNGATVPLPGQIIEFTGSFSARNADGKYKDNVVTVFNDSGSSYDLSTHESDSDKAPLYSSRVAGYAHTHQEGELMLDVYQKSDYDHYATATVTGAPGLRPGGLVTVDKYGGNMDGEWYVQGLKHVLHSSAFITEVKLARNNITQLFPDRTAPFQTPPEPILTGEGWKAKKKTVNAY